MSAKTRPILFSGPMVRAILDGRKTQTRRVVKPQPEYVGPAGGQADPGSWGWETSDGYWVLLDQSLPHSGYERRLRCPFGQPGDRLWVRECFAFGTQDKQVFYRADRLPGHANTLRWRPSIHMPRWASRVMLEVTGVRVERVQSINPADALAEWCSAEQHSGGLGDPCDELRLLQSFQYLWDSINAKRGFGWEQNPWVWVVEFKKVDP